MKKILVLSLITILVVSLTFSGCGLFSSFSSSSTPLQTTQSLVAGGVLRLADAEPTTLDPAISTESTSTQYILLIYSGLTRLNENMEPVPDIAESWTVDSAGTTYTFKLRQDVRFQNGNAVKAADFKYSWERAASPTTGSTTAATYLGDILGVNEMLAGKARSITGVSAPDDYTLKVTIDSPKAYFLYKLSFPTTFVVDKNSAGKGGEWWRSPGNGSGPFKLSNWKRGESITLSRNENYYGKKTALKSVVFSFYSGLPMDLYETGEIDVTGISTAYYDAVMDQKGPFYQDLNISSDLTTIYLGFNCRQAPFYDVNIRRAFSLAVDRDKIIKLIYRDMQKRADGILPPGLPGYNPELKAIEFNPAKARELIKSSRYGDVSKLPEVTLTTNGYGANAGQLLQALVYQWQENLGIKVVIRQVDDERYFYNTKDEIDQVYLMGWSADYPHPQDFIDILFSSDAGYNYGSYSNLQVDKLVQTANGSNDEQTTFKLYQQAEQIIIEDAAALPITFGMNYFLVKSYVKNFKLSPLGFATLRDVTLADR